MMTYTRAREVAHSATTGRDGEQVFIICPQCHQRQTVTLGPPGVTIPAVDRAISHARQGLISHLQLVCRWINPQSEGSTDPYAVIKRR
jgi:cytochrome c2